MIIARMNAMKTLYSIYCIENVLNGLHYIGQTRCPKARKKEHFVMLKRGNHYNRHLQNVYNKHGKDVFTFQIIETNIPLKEINDREVHWISFFNSYHNGYNLSPGGNLPIRSRCKPVEWNGVTYPSVRVAAESLSISAAAVRERRDNGHVCDADLAPKNQPVTYDGIEYPNIKSAAKANGISRWALADRLRKGNLSDRDVFGYRYTTWNGIEYESIQAAAIATGYPVHNLRKYIERGYTHDNELKDVGRTKKKPVTWNGIQYPSVRAAAKACGIDCVTMGKRIKKGFTNDTEVNLPTPSIGVEIDGCKFSSLIQASKFYNVTHTTISNWIKSGKARKIE
jgi:hypothetical protein